VRGDSCWNRLYQSSSGTSSSNLFAGEALAGVEEEFKLRFHIRLASAFAAEGASMSFVVPYNL